MMHWVSLNSGFNDAKVKKKNMDFPKHKNKTIVGVTKKGLFKTQILK